MGNTMGNDGTTRRDFLAGAAAVAAAAAAVGPVHAAGNDKLKVALIGCGGRGRGAMVDAINASKGKDGQPMVEIIGLADVFDERVQEARSIAGENGQKVADDCCFVGFDAVDKALGLPADYVILATPPHFRPGHLTKAIAAKKHVFMEKPVAVDAPGCREVILAGEIAAKAKLAIVAGTQRRHEKVYQEAYKRVQDGAIGQIVAARCYWNQGQLWYKNRESGWNDMAWMIRDWVNWKWLSGDHICEQHVHNLDVCNWFLSKDNGSANPIKAIGMGGRAHRVTGDQFDYFAVDFEYEGGVHVSSFCRQVNDTAPNVSEAVVGTKGRTQTSSGHCHVFGDKTFRFDGGRLKQVNPYVQEHIDLQAAIRGGQYMNEARNIAISTLTAVMGRVAAYTGREVSWNEIYESSDRLGPAKYDWDVRCPEVVIARPGRA